MKRGKAKAVTWTDFNRGKPPKDQASLVDLMAEFFLKNTGLKRTARAKLRASIFEAQSESYVQSLYAMINDVVDGGAKGLTTALKVCFCMKK